MSEADTTKGKRTPHERWVAWGRCPVISRTKSWCDLSPGHEGKHHAPYLNPDGSYTDTWWSA